MTAARTLFGPEARVNDEFVARLDEPGLKRVFRKRALETHPDRAKTLGRSEMLMRAQFHRVNQAYELLAEAIKRGETLRVIDVEAVRPVKIPTPPPFIHRAEPTRAKVETPKEARQSTVVPPVAPVAPKQGGWFPVLVIGAMSLAAGAVTWWLTEPTPSVAVTASAVEPAPRAEPEPAPIPPKAWDEALRDEFRTVPGVRVSFDAARQAVRVDFGDNVFKSGHYRPSGALRDGLHNLAEIAARQQESLRLTVIGHSDKAKVKSSRKRFSDNQALSMVRAKEAMRVLREAGFSLGLMEARGVGSRLRDSRSVSVLFERLTTTVVELADDVFNAGQYRMSPRIVREVGRMILQSGQLPTGTVITVTGHADSIPVTNVKLPKGLASNTDIANLRAESVAQFLREQLGNDYQIRVSTAGTLERQTRSVTIRIER